MNNPFTGAGVALVTPFLENEQIDFDALFDNSFLFIFLFLFPNIRIMRDLLGERQSLALFYCPYFGWQSHQIYRR